MTIVYLSAETCTHFHWERKNGVSIPTWHSTYTALITRKGHKPRKIEFCHTALDRFYRRADSLKWHVI